MARQIAPGVFVTEVPTSQSYTASRAAQYTESVSKSRWDRWNVAVKAATAIEANDQKNYLSRQKLLTDAITDLDKEIASAKKLSEDFIQGGIKAQETLDRHNRDNSLRLDIANARLRQSADAGNANIANGYSSQGFRANAANEKTTINNYDTVRGDMTAGQVFQEPTGKPNTPDANITNPQFGLDRAKQHATSGKAGGKTTVPAATYVYFEEQAKNISAMPDGPTKAAAMREYNKLFDANENTYKQGEKEIKGPDGSGMSVVDGSSGGGTHYRAQQVQPGSEAKLDSEARKALEDRYMKELQDLETKRTSLKNQQASLKAPTIDPIQDARDQYANAFGASRNYTDNKRAKALEAVMDSFITKEIGSIEGEATPEKIAAARGLGVTKALEALKGRSYKEPVAPVVEKPAEKSNGPFVSKVVPEHGDYQISYKQNPEPYTANPNGRPEIIVFDNKTKKAETFTEDMPAYEELLKQFQEQTGRSVSLELKQGRQPLASDGEADWVDDERVKAWNWDPSTKTYITENVNDPREKQVYGPQSKEAIRLEKRSKIQQNLFYQEKARVDNERITKENAAKKAEEIPSKKTFTDLMDNPPKPDIGYKNGKTENGPSGSIAPAKKEVVAKATPQQEDKDNRMKAVISGYKLQDQPNKLDRVAKNTEYGKVVVAMIDTNASLGDKALSPKDIQKRILDEFSGDYGIQTKALELANALLIKDSKKNLVVA